MEIILAPVMLIIGVIIWMLLSIIWHFICVVISDPLIEKIEYLFNKSKKDKTDEQ